MKISENLVKESTDCGDEELFLLAHPVYK